MLAVFKQRLLQRAEVAGLGIAPEHIEPLAQYFELLERWNRSINLTSLPLSDVSPSAIDRLFIDPLLALSLLRTPPASWFDLGSGGGSPAVPMRIALGSKGKLTMVEARSRKASFLREVVRELGLLNVEVLEARIETLRAKAAIARSAELVTSRAVRIEESIEEAIAELSAIGGTLMLFTTADAPKVLPAGFLPARIFNLPEGRRIQPFVRLP